MIEAIFISTLYTFLCFDIDLACILFRVGLGGGYFSLAEGLWF